MANLQFIHLNPDWNAEPNAPDLTIEISDNIVSIGFLLNPWAYEAIDSESGIVNFLGCSRWRTDPTNDSEWFKGTGRFSREAPESGEFFEVVGTDVSARSYEWNIISEEANDQRHFIFYFRDEAFECFARDWSLVISKLET